METNLHPVVCEFKLNQSDSMLSLVNAGAYKSIGQIKSYL